MTRAWIFCVVLALSSHSLAGESSCDSPEKARAAFLGQPWPEIDAADAGEQPRKLQLGASGELKEGELLEYFVRSPEKAPEIESKASYETHEPGFRSALERTWKFPGLTIQAGVGRDGELYPFRTALDSGDYGLICGLRVGAKLDEFRRVLGEPSRSETIAAGTRLSWLDKIGMFRVDANAEGTVVRIEWEMERC